jgi:hypothetical protein
MAFQAGVIAFDASQSKSIGDQFGCRIAVKRIKRCEMGRSMPLERFVFVALGA